MSVIAAFVIATFTVPESIGANPQAILWLLPLMAAVVIVYKATKLPTITAGTFLKETAILFGSIIVFIVMIALALYALSWLITE
jgi:hypothetical protein